MDRFLLVVFCDMGLPAFASDFPRNLTQDRSLYPPPYLEGAIPPASMWRHPMLMRCARPNQAVPM